MSEKVLNAALEYLERGWSVIPVRKGQKTPLVSWKEYQDRLPTEDEIYRWFDKTENDIAIICGKVSGLAVVDTDNQEATEQARLNGWDRTPYRVKTRKGYHFYFSTDKRIQKGKLTDKIDLQAEASYVLAPPSTDKTLALLDGCDPDELPPYRGPMAGEHNVIPIQSHERYEDLNLDNIIIRVPVMEAAQQFVSENGRLLRAGDNCHNRLVSLVGELFAEGLQVEEIHSKCHQFCNEFMDHPFDDKKIVGVIKDIGRNEIRKAERKIEDNPKEPSLAFEPITTHSIPELESKIGDQTFFVDPIIPSNDASLTMIFGYSGHGKSMFARNMLYASCVGQMNYGPFILTDRPRVLYLDLENGRRNVLRFLKQAKKTYGDAKEKFMMFSPFMHMDMNLKTEAGVGLLLNLIEQTKANIVCIDTVRTAFVGMSENEGKEWSGINSLILKLRNSGISVVLVHHANKPQGDGASGSYAGSTNALTNLEFGIKITQVFDEEERARAKAGLFAGSIENPLLHNLYHPLALTDGERMAVKMEVRFVKNREADESLEDLSYVGFASNYDTDTFRCVSTKTAKQSALDFAQPWVDKDGVVKPPLSDKEISAHLNIHPSIMSEWTSKVRAKQVASFIANNQ